MMKKGSILLLALLIAVPGCRKKGATAKKKSSDVHSQVDMPVSGANEFEVADESVRSFFEDGDMADIDDMQDEFVALAPQDAGMAVDAQHDKHDFAWVQENDADVQPVLFDFDKYSVRADQAPVVKKDIAYAQKTLASESVDGAQPVVVIEGHACHSAGSDVYNLALSEKRAKVVADRFVGAGVSRENIKVVGRGNHVPAVINGKEVTGGRAQQAPNRRVEVHAIYS